MTKHQLNKLDKQESTIRNLAEDFSRIATENNGQGKIMSQFHLGRVMGMDVGKGFCHGLSILWLAYKLKSPFGKNLLQELAGGHLESASLDELKESVWQNHISQQQDNENDEKGTHKAMSDLGLNWHDKKLYGGGFASGHSSLGTYISNNPGYFLLNVPGHVMAAYSCSSTPIFYDPNIGEASFTSGDSLGKFFSDYFKSPEANKQYTHGQGGKVQVTVNRYI